MWTGEENSEWSDLTTAESPHNWRNKVNSEATITQFLNGDGVLFTDAATNKEVRIGAVGVNVTSFVVETDAIGNDSYFFIGGPIGGETSFVKRGLGDVAFASANTFTGGTAIEDGIVTLFAADALGTGDVANKGVLDLAYSGAFQNNVAGSGYIYVRQAASITFDGNIRNTTLWNDGVTRLNEVRVVSATEEVQSYLGIKADGLLEALGLPPPSPDGPALIEIVLNGVGKPVAVNNELERGVTHRFGDVINNGLIDFVHGGYTLEVASLSTSAGKTGTVRMDIDLLQKNNSDKLVVAGAIKGRHNILMTDASADPNAIRRDSGRGLIVVQAGDISQADVSGKLIAGAYTFSLAANGSNGYTLATASGYSPAASTAIALSASIAPAWFSQLDSLNKRLGDLRLGKAAKSEETDGKKKNDTGTTASQPDNDLWLRAHGQRINSDLGVAGVSNFAEYQYGGDVGVDHEFKFDKSSLFLGAFAGYQHANRSFRDGFGSTSDTDVLAGGLYATWLTSCGFFIDGVVKGQFSETAYRAFSTEADYDNTGLGASLEFGKQFTFGKKDRWFVEPTLQFDYLHVFAETYSTNDGLRVKNGDSDIFRLAGHLRLGRTFAFSPENRFQPYVRLGIENQFSYGGSVRIADSKVEANTDGARFNMGLGAAWQFNQSMQVHFDYEASFGDKYDRPWGFNAGFRYRF